MLVWPFAITKFNRFLRAGCSSLTIGIFIASLGARIADGDPAAPEARLAVLDRLLNLRSVDVRFTESIDYTPSKDSLEMFNAMKVKGKPYQGRFEYRNHFMFLDGRAFFERHTLPATLARAHAEGMAEEPTDVIFISAPERFETFTRYEGITLTGQIGDPADLELPQNWLIDTALGLRGRAGWLDKDSLAEAETIVDPGDPDCVIVRAKVGHNGSLIDSWWCKRVGKDMIVNKYTLSRARGNLEVGVQIDCDGFQKVNGFVLPKTITTKTYTFSPKGGAPYAGQTSRIDVESCDVDAKQNNAEKYVMIWPKGTNVFDKRTRESFIIRDGPRPLDDDYISGTLEKNLRKTQDRLNSIATQPSPTTGP